MEKRPGQRRAAEMGEVSEQRAHCDGQGHGVQKMALGGKRLREDDRQTLHLGGRKSVVF